MDSTSIGSAELWQQMLQDSNEDMAAARRALAAQLHPGTELAATADEEELPTEESTYAAARAKVLADEKAMAFGARCRARATPLEIRANDVLVALRAADDANIYDAAPPRPIAAGGGSVSLAPGSAAALDRCELQFCVLGEDVETAPGNVFASDYAPRQTMRFRDFMGEFPRWYPDVDVDRWLERKLVLEADQVYAPLQTAEGAWRLFNARTRMMKGLFGYRAAFCAYTRLFCEDLARDGVVYAEVRPNFMPSNRLRRDDGSGPLGNEATVELLVDVVSRFRDEQAARGRFFGGLKVIYCTPRSFDPAAVGEALDECLRFKKRWPEWIAGFDLVGEEAQGRPLRDFAGVLLAFKRRCAAEGVEVRLRARGVCVELCPVSNEVLGLTPRADGHAMYALLANNVHCTVNSDNGGIFQYSPPVSLSLGRFFPWQVGQSTDATAQVDALARLLPGHGRQAGRGPVWLEAAGALEHRARVPRARRARRRPAPLAGPVARVPALARRRARRGRRAAAGLSSAVDARCGSEPGTNQGLRYVDLGVEMSGAARDVHGDERAVVDGGGPSVRHGPAMRLCGPAPGRRNAVWTRIRRPRT
ncbi:hypothetical protein HIM_06886 [Hirsutella minnesotensis 3608]|uniref:Adenosine deaminase domain-containing protein n=1 Tax=Hirsutella minnesotensis 3608 TaxID=1043627 RepID=A0A0F7ZTV4_9HYPO|nr:hypothetical protein HIM_06886 [Hirsutella minnesotensis 3608]